MREKKPSPSLALVPPDADYFDLVHAARGCQACDLYKRATQTVFGEGRAPAVMMLVGEQPGDQEDKLGHPFVGPAGRILDAALAEADIPRDQIYLTNTVKHFKWEPRGKRRLHGKPNAVEIHACNGWLQAEVAIVKPTVIVCLGATASQAFLGRAFRLTNYRGKVLDGGAGVVDHLTASIVATYHPSALLRMMRDEEAYEKARAELESDLALAASLVSFRAGRSRLARSSRSTAAATRRG